MDLTQETLFEQFRLFELPLHGAYDPTLFPKNFNVQTTVDKMRVILMSHEKVMCSISGGWDSDIMLDLLIRCGGRENVTFCFFDTGLEYNATKEHIRYLEETYGIDKGFATKESNPDLLPRVWRSVLVKVRIRNDSSAAKKRLSVGR